MRIGKGYFCAFFAIFLLPLLCFGVEQRVPNAAVHPGNKFAQPSILLPGGEAVAIRLPTGLQGEWVRMSFATQGDSNKQWRLIIKSASGALLDSIPSKMLASRTWTRKYKEPILWLSVPPEGVVTTIEKVMVHYPALNRYSIIGDQNLDSVTELGPSSWILGLAKGVVLLEIEDVDGKNYPCTGFVIGEDLIMTNAHCVKTDWSAKRTSAYFDYVSREMPESVSQVVSLLAVNEVLDVAVLKTHEIIEKTRRLNLAVGDVKVGDSLIMIQQYEGGPQKISRDSDCKVKMIPVRGKAIAYGNFDFTDYEAAFVHGCDTEDMSSGSPVFEKISRQVVGLHFWGKGSSDAKGNRAIRSSKLLCWMKSEIENGNPWLSDIVPSNLECVAGDKL